MGDTPNRDIVEKTDSAEITINAKGDPSFKVKIYDEDGEVAVEKTIVAMQKFLLKWTEANKPTG